MKSRYLLIINLVGILLLNFLLNIRVINFSSFYNNILNNQENNISSDKYLQLTYQNGQFYSWDQTNDTNQHIIGIFTNTEQSYLFDNYGVYWSLEYQIINFQRVNNKIGIAQIEYFQNKNKKEYFNENFFIELENNRIFIINDMPIISKNPYFVALNEEYVVGYGIGLDLIKISKESITSKILIPPSEKSSFFTNFYPINDKDGIFVATDQYFYLLKNIIENFSQTKINLKASMKNTNDVVKINENNLVIRDKNNMLYFFDTNQITNIKNWRKISSAKNFAFALDKDTFILNISLENSGTEYGKPYLIKTSNWNNLVEIPNIKTIKNFMFINDKKGIFIDKNLVSNIFSYQKKDSSFIINKFGNLDNFQFINNNLFFASINNNNLLASLNENEEWAFKNKINFYGKNPQGKFNLLNNIFVSNKENINYQNTFFSNGPANINISDEKLVNVVVTTSVGTRILWPDSKRSINYDFLDFDTYKIVITFFSNDITYTLNYQVKVIDLSKENLINISGLNLISYVGYNKNNLEKQLFDIKVINQKKGFIINQFNYNFLQYVELYIFGDSKNMIVKTVYNLVDNTEIKAVFKPEDERLFFGLKIVNLFNQVNWIYLGFNNGSEKPMIDFWDTENGKKLMNQALMRRYSEKELKSMDSQQIKKLILISNNWNAVASQGKTIVISVISIFIIAVVGICLSFGYNVWLNKKIKIEEVERNKVFKDPFNF